MHLFLLARKIGPTERHSLPPLQLPALMLKSTRTPCSLQKRYTLLCMGEG